jgi:hypothetical protein
MRTMGSQVFRAVITADRSGRAVIRAARIAEVVDLLAAGVKERPRAGSPPTT